MHPVIFITKLRVVCRFFLTIPEPKMNTSNSTTINVQETKAEAKGKARLIAAPVVASTKAIPHPNAGWKKGIAIFDFLLRLVAVAATLSAAVAMGTTDQTLPFFTQHFQFHASFEDLPAFL